MLTPDEVKKVEVFKDTYDAMHLKDISYEKIEQIKLTSNPVQQTLINNLKKLNDPNHPYNIELIEGPVGVRKFQLKDKTINIFGEIHRVTIGSCMSDKAVEFNKYLELLSRDSPAFYDVYVEIPMVKEQKNSLVNSSILMQIAIWDMYNSNISFLDAYKSKQSPKMSPPTSTFMFRKIINSFKRCIQPKLRLNANECKLLRIHNVDLRSTWDIEKLNVTKQSLNLYKEDVALYLIHSIISIGVKQKKFKSIIDVIKRVNKDCPAILNSLEMLIANDNINILDIFNTNKSFKKELDASYKKKEIERWLIKMVNNTIPEYLSIKVFMIIIKKLISSIKNNTDFPYFKMENLELINSISLTFLELNVFLLDAYCLSRIFKVHDLKKHISTGEFQPQESKNIIIYAGDTHSDNMAQFFHSIGFKPVYNYYNPTQSSCVNMKNPNTFRYVNRKMIINSPLKSPVVQNNDVPPRLPVGQNNDFPLARLTPAGKRTPVGQNNDFPLARLTPVGKRTPVGQNNDFPLASLSPVGKRKPDFPVDSLSYLSKLNIVQLRDIAKKMKLSGYSKYKKNELILFISQKMKPQRQPQRQPQTSQLLSPSKLNKLTVIQLKNIAKKMKLSGYSKYKRKYELIAFIKSNLSK